MITSFFFGIFSCGISILFFRCMTKFHLFWLPPFVFCLLLSNNSLRYTDFGGKESNNCLNQVSNKIIDIAVVASSTVLNIFCSQQKGMHELPKYWHH